MGKAQQSNMSTSRTDASVGASGGGPALRIRRESQPREGGPLSPGGPVSSHAEDHVLEGLTGARPARLAAWPAELGEEAPAPGPTVLHPRPHGGHWHIVDALEVVPEVHSGHPGQEERGGL